MVSGARTFGINGDAGPRSLDAMNAAKSSGTFDLFACNGLRGIEATDQPERNIKLKLQFSMHRTAELT